MQEPNHWVLSVEEGAELAIKSVLHLFAKRWFIQKSNLKNLVALGFLLFFFFYEPSGKIHTEGMNDRVFKT